MIRAATAGLAGSLLLTALHASGAAASCVDACPRTLLAQADPASSAPASPGSSAGGSGTAAQPSPVSPAPSAVAPTGAPPPTAAAPPPPQPNTAAAPVTTGVAPPPLGAVRNNPRSAVSVPGGLNPQYYGGTLSSPGRAQGGLQPAYGSTQRNIGLSDTDNAQPIGGASPYGGTQSTIGTPQFSNAPTYGRPVTAGTTGASTQRSLTGTTLPGNPNNYGQAPLGSSPNTRDQVGNYGGGAGYTAQGVYTGTAGQSIGYGQPYALSGRLVGGTASSLPDATTPLRPYVPPIGGRGAGPINSGYGIPNGSRATTMDARGIQRGY